VQIVRIVPQPTTRIVVVLCVYCSRAHSHGFPYEIGDRSPGHRVPHCGQRFRNAPGRDRGYVIEAPTFPCGRGDVEAFGKPFRRRSRT
jgi:hypothetical protein